MGRVGLHAALNSTRPKSAKDARYPTGKTFGLIHCIYGSQFRSQSRILSYFRTLPECCHD